MSNSSAPIRGIIEGFYGVYYTVPERNDLIRFGARHGFNHYFYGPKNDRQHRARWWEAYPDEVMAQFAETIALAAEHGMRFVYTLSPISAEPRDLSRIMAKLEAFYGLGVRDFGLFLDDIAGPEHDGNAATHAAHMARDHAKIVNAVAAELRLLDASCTLVFCPAEYHGGPSFGPYLHTLGEQLDQAVDLFYTGTAICARTIHALDVEAFARVAGRKPIIWDNYPANDLDMRGELHLGPSMGRSTDLLPATKGVAVNLMNQCEASKIALATYGEYLANPHTYEPWQAWDRALYELGGAACFEALRAVAETSLHSCLLVDDAPELAELVLESVAALRAGQRPTRCEALHRLEAQINQLDEACYALKNRMPNLRLRDNMIPWIEALEDWVWMGRRAIHALQAEERGEPYKSHLAGMRASLVEIEKHHKRICWGALMPLAEYTNEHFEQRVRTAAEPAPVFSFLPALG